MNSMPQVDVVLVNWNSGEQLAECIRSLVALQQRSSKIATVCVVDNASRDESVRKTRDAADQIGLPVNVIINEMNLGFATACNQGARTSRSEYILFLNPDTLVKPESLDLPVLFMQRPENSSVGICGIRMVDSSDEILPSCYRFPTLRTFIGEMTRLSTLCPRIFPPHQIPVSDLAHNRTVDQVMGSFFLVRRSLYESLGGFDERFFVYFEEVDFCYRARQLGFSSFYFTEAAYFHAVGACSAKAKADRLSYSLYSRMQYATKHFGKFRRSLLLMLTLTVEFSARLIGALLGKSSYDLAEVLLGYRKFLTVLIRPS